MSRVYVPVLWIATVSSLRANYNYVSKREHWTGNEFLLKYDFRNGIDKVVKNQVY
jgi:hypothetical protein